MPNARLANVAQLRRKLPTCVRVRLHCFEEPCPATAQDTQRASYARRTLVGARQSYFIIWK